MPTFDRRAQLHEELEAGDYAIVFRHDGRDVRVSTHEELDDAHDRGLADHLLLHRPRHLFARLSVLGDRFRPTSDGGTIELDGTVFAVTDIEPHDESGDTVVVRLADDAPDAYTVATHPSMTSVGYELPGVSLVHGFRFWSHIGWFSDVADSGPWNDQGAITGFSAADRAMVPDFVSGAMPTPVPSAPKIGLIDNGVDTDHVWMKDAVEGDGAGNNPTDVHGDHGTMVAGVIRQTAPTSKIRSKKVTLPERVQAGIADEQHIGKALTDLKNHDVTIAVMAFGAEVLGGNGSQIQQDISNYVTPKGKWQGGHVFAAAGNLEPDGGEERSMVYPAAYDDVIGVAAVDANGAYCAWSNGWDATWTGDNDPGLNQTVSVVDATRPDGWLFTSLGILRDADGKEVKDSDGTLVPTFVKGRGTSLVVAIAAGGAAGGATPFPTKV